MEEADSVARPYENLFLDMMCGRLDLPRGTIKAILVTKDYKFKPETHSRRSDVAECEVHGKGYIVGGIELSGKDVKKVNGRSIFCANSLQWPEVTVKAFGAIVYQAGDSGHLNRDILICYEQFSEELSATNGELEVTWPEGVIFSMGARK